MARLPRLTVAGYPHHIIQRGNNRQPIFLGEADFTFMRELLFENARKFGVELHAYVLMDNHFHLLATPRRENTLSAMMQAVGRRYVRYFNDTHGRSGTLWEGRYKSTLVEAERYLLACMVYIDLNPVRAGMVARAQDCRWSSHAHYIGALTDKLVTAHPLYWALGNTPFAREMAYAQLVQAGLGESQRDAVTDATLHGWALGSAGFVKNLAEQTPRRALRARAGRPPVRKLKQEIQS